jgi:hypothetical protein
VRKKKQFFFEKKNQKTFIRRWQHRLGQFGTTAGRSK